MPSSASGSGAKWTRSIGGEHLGYPRTASFVRDNTSGANPLIGVDVDGAEQVDRVMCALRNTRPALFWPLKLYYLDEKPQPVAADVCRCSVAMFRNLVRQGEMFVAGALIGGHGGEKFLLHR